MAACRIKPRCPTRILQLIPVLIIALYLCSLPTELRLCTANSESPIHYSLVNSSACFFDIFSREQRLND